MPGRLRRFRNKELAQDFAECDLMARSMRWLRRREHPMRILVELRIRLPAPAHQARIEDAAQTILPLELCLVERPMLRASFCTQPLYGFHGLRAEAPWVIEDWLDYHLGHLGFE